MVGSVSRQYFISTTSASLRLMGLLFVPAIMSMFEYVWSVLVPFAFLFHIGHSSPSLCVYPFRDSGGDRPTGCWGMLHQCRICSMANVMHDNIRSSAPFEQGFQQYTPSNVVAFCVHPSHVQAATHRMVSPIELPAQETVGCGCSLHAVS
jgi:hypothetical protein